MAEDSDPKSKAERAILGFLESHNIIEDSHQLAARDGISHNDLESVIRSLTGFQFVESKDIRREQWVLTEEAKSYALNGSPEVQVFMAVPPEGTSRAAIEVDHVKDVIRDLLNKIEHGEIVAEKDTTVLKKRKLVTLQTWKGYSVMKGPRYAPERKKPATDLTREHLLRDEWRDLEFKDYNLDVQEQPIQIGYQHPLLDKDIHIQVFEVGSFWNFDALFQPQQHPARDSHDTFFLNDPSTTRDIPEDYLEKVKQVHEIGGFGSRGYRYQWKRDEAEKNLLRTHTTAVSTRMLYRLVQKPFTPKRYYSIDRVFRNEAVDRTHLAEFHQIEGLICDRNLTLGHLIGVLDDFFASLGMHKLRFKPAYNPYTEPSMEIFSYHEGLNKWVEVGNSGMFRPEMLRTMGFPKDVSVIAWGLSLERPTMILYGINNIRDLFGPKVDFNLIKKSKICRLGLQLSS